MAPASFGPLSFTVTARAPCSQPIISVLLDGLSFFIPPTLTTPAAVRNRSVHHRHQTARLFHQAVTAALTHSVYRSRGPGRVDLPDINHQTNVFVDDVLVNRKPCDCDVVADCKVGDAVTLKVKLTNMSKNPVGPLTLTVVPYQDYQNGIQNYDLDEAVTFIGSNTFFVDMVKPKESSVCEGALLFLYTGDFYLNIKVQDDSTQRELPLAWFTLPGVHIRAQDTPLQAGA
ncbi:hypothetical protein ILYODFUR_025075 [Ilyodon furcidens]|uniref:Trs120/TRAPPC9 fourth Ig-like domain-containing protein n=1 Tax=Ilyodon furcidens TaxID=33524 RepID=A0ABV0T1D1_9TELE